mgnify:CR=1 FL=1
MVSRKRNSVIYRFASLLLVLMLSACSALQGTPQPAPPVTDHPQEIRRDQTQGVTANRQRKHDGSGFSG